MDKLCLELVIGENIYMSEVGICIYTAPPRLPMGGGRYRKECLCLVFIAVILPTVPALTLLCWQFTYALPVVWPAFAYALPLLVIYGRDCHPVWITNLLPSVFDRQTIWIILKKTFIDYLVLWTDNADSLHYYNKVVNFIDFTLAILSISSIFY